MNILFSKSHQNPHRVMRFKLWWTLFEFVCGDSPLVEMKGIEPLTPCLQGRCSPSWATPPYWEVKNEKRKVKNVGWKSLAIFFLSSYLFLSFFTAFTVPENRTTNRSYETLSRRFCFLCEFIWTILFQSFLLSIERRWSSRTFRYGYLVTT